MRQKFWHYARNSNTSSKDRRSSIRHDNPILRKEGGGGEGCLWLEKRWSRMKKQPGSKGCFLFLDQFSSFFFSPLDTAVHRCSSVGVFYWVGGKPSFERIITSTTFMAVFLKLERIFVVVLVMLSSCLLVNEPTILRFSRKNSSGPFISFPKT